MPVETAEVTRIKCDNPACPGTDLDETDRKGWLFVSGEVYGEASQQFVFCSTGCLSAASGDEAKPMFAAPEAPTAPVPAEA